MADAVGKILSYMLYAFTIILIVIVMLTRMDGVLDSYITNKATSFVDTCRTTGRIEPEIYEKFAQNVYSVGNYSIEISHGRKIGLWDEEENKPTVEYNEVYTSQILDYMYPDEEDVSYPYAMNNGDILSIKITKKGNGLGGSLLSVLVGNAAEPTIVVNYSGTIGSNGY